MVIDRYMMTIRRRVDHQGHFTFQHELKAANAILKDHKSLLEFFDKHLEVLQHGGLRPMPITTAAGKTGVTIPLSTNDLLQRKLDPLPALAQIVGSRSFINAENNAKLLFLRYGIDGLKVVQACFLCNPTISKIDRIAISEQMKKLFDSQAENGKKYVMKPMEEYLAFDTGLDAAVAVKEAAPKSKSGGFWSRRKG